MEELRNNLKEIENKIKEYYNITIYEDGDIWYSLKDDNIKENKELEELFSKRQGILQEMFQQTPEEMKRLQQVSNHLKYLTKKMYERMVKMGEKVKLICDDPDFDDDYEIEGKLCFSYDGPNSVLKLENDDVYGSDFSGMIQALDTYYYNTGNDFLKTIINASGVNNDNLDDDLNWNVIPMSFEDMDICFAAHSVVDHHYYSTLDLIRMNDFWVEVKFREQSITDQNGKKL